MFARIDQYGLHEGVDIRAAEGKVVGEELWDSQAAFGAAADYDGEVFSDGIFGLISGE